MPEEEDELKKGEIIKGRLAALREDMREEGVDLALFTSSDDHASEYVSAYFKVTEFLTGCTSDNVILLVSCDKALLWTDGRYFISAAEEIRGTEWRLMKMGEPGVGKVTDIIRSTLKAGKTLGFDGRTVTVRSGAAYRKLAEEKGAHVNGAYAPAERIWKGRPKKPVSRPYILPDSLTGEGAGDKINRSRKSLKGMGASAFVLSKLDDIMWLLNIRADDIHCCPVALSYLYLGEEDTVLFLQAKEGTDEIREYAKKTGFRILPYEEAFSEIRRLLTSLPGEGKVLLDPGATSDAMYGLIREAVGERRILPRINPTTLMKAVKNPVEIRHTKETYLKDSAALCRFIYWVKKNIGRTPMTEVSAAEYLDHLRSEIPGFIELSFDTISAFGPNAAMAHYAPDEKTAAVLQPEGFLLVDSGATYFGGTTDVTRTIVLGPLSDQMKRDFTTVAVSNLRLLYAKFLKGTTGVGLDTYARAPFWERGLDFNHGTGHGIGYILNVHEGPQSIRRHQAGPAFVPGMITSDEPGIYREGEYGIRTETITLCVEDESTAFGDFLRFEPLTYAPIDLEGIDPSLMDRSDIEKLNAYHRKVWKEVSPYLTDEEGDWLYEATRPVGKG